ncbi:MAG: TPM domain-containing protein [Bacteroidia bacterium]
MRIVYALFFIGLLITACGRNDRQKISYVNDNANILTEDQESKLAEYIKELEQSIGSQIFILTILSLDGEKIEDYSLRIANTWKIGRVEFDDGILITVAVQDRQMRIEVGYGLEKIIKDEIAAQIIRDDMAPNFRSDKYFEGLDLAVGKIKTLIKDNKELVGQRL